MLLSENIIDKRPGVIPFCTALHRTEICLCVFIFYRFHPDSKRHSGGWQVAVYLL